MERDRGARVHSRRGYVGGDGGDDVAAYDRTGEGQRGPAAAGRDTDADRACPGGDERIVQGGQGDGATGLDIAALDAGFDR
jgi:hypothetical protein